MHSWCFGEYQATALAEPRTCSAYSKANTGSSTRIFQSWFFSSTATPESTLKLKGPAICKKLQRQFKVNIHFNFIEIQQLHKKRS